ncbi:hypothetical protein CFC21_085075 [Triticum aestivum]|uniref:Serine-rich protein n=2 Tax=Triticum aestivum TaxID=4565 RepID=A0A9R1IBF7_WHEAT|nr:uncharacterized protein LOC123131215 [Triticum aestivum]KAF7081102.1 hypothetical protein CFC21_085075 [Triticum aestivum]
MATAAASRPSGPVLSTPNCRSYSSTPVKLAGGDATHLLGKSVSVSSPSPTRSQHYCTCSATNHPGSFRCSVHKERKQVAPAGSSKPPSPPSIRGLGSKRMSSRQCARRALKPSPAVQQSQQRRRAGGFRPRPSRLSAVSTAGERPRDN